MPRTSSHTADRSSPPAAQPTAGATLPAAADALEHRLVHIWEKTLARRPIGVDDNFFALNGNSLKAVRLCDRVWRETGHRVPPAILLESPTIATFAVRLRQPDATRSGLIAVRTSGTKRPLFVAPGAGPRALYMRNLAEHLGAEQPLYLLQEPPGAAPSGADRSVEGLAQRFIVGMRRVQPRGPYDVVGISFGGLLAYEVARQLVAGGEQVGLLGLLDTRHPAYSRRRPSVAPGAFARRLANQVVIVRRVGRRRGGRYLRNRVRIGWSRFLEGLREGFASRLPADLASFIRDGTLEWERAWQAADAQASARYRPLPYPGRLTFLWAEHSPTPADRSAWAELAAGGFDARPVPGGHFTLLVEPLAGITASILANVLDAARAATGSMAK